MMEITTDKDYKVNDNESGFVPPAKEVVKEEKKESYVPPPPYKPFIMFAQRLTKAKIEDHFRKFVEILKRLYINIPLIEVLSQILYYVIFLMEFYQTSENWKISKL